MLKLTSLAIGLLTAITIAPAAQAMNASGNTPATHQASENLHAQIIIKVNPQIGGGYGHDYERYEHERRERYERERAERHHRRREELARREHEAREARARWEAEQRRRYEYAQRRRHEHREHDRYDGYYHRR
jgi:hypothetical protein